MSPLGALVLDWLLTAFWPLIGASGVKLYSGVLFTWAGLVVGFLCMAPWLAARGGLKRVLSRELAPTLMAMGLLSGLASIIFICALAYTTPANAAIMAQVEVLYSALLCAYFLGERFSRAQGAASALIMTGTGLIMAHDLGSPRWKGDLMILLTPWLFQLSHIFAKRLPKDLDPVAISAGRVLFGLLATLPACLWTLAHSPRWSWSPEGLAVLFAQGLLMSCLNFVLWYRAILNMDLAKATAFLLSYPALTLIFSWALGREDISGVQVGGLLVTLAGAYWLSRLMLQAEARPAQAAASPAAPAGAAPR